MVGRVNGRPNGSSCGAQRISEKEILHCQKDIFSKLKIPSVLSFSKSKNISSQTVELAIRIKAMSPLDTARPRNQISFSKFLL